ncbi:MAG: TonB-dependent receptor [Rikenellaceae bacterium]
MKKNIFIYFIWLCCISFCSTVQAQDRVVTGSVFDKAKQPIIGATIMVKGTTQGTTTDLDGKFSIGVTTSNQTIEVSYISMVAQNVNMTNRNNVTITLDDDNKVLEEVVVIGYGAVKKKELTGAVAQIKSEALDNSVTSDLGSALQGLVSGVNVTSESGAPGESATILIRGVSSVSGSNTPLYVVDGVPYDGDPNISPNEIQTIDILKDAASCAIYGTRGAAGVILITTKQGQKGAAKISFNASYGIQQLNEGQNLMNAVEQTYFDTVYGRNIKGTTDDSLTLQLNDQAGYYTNDTDLLSVIFPGGLVSTQNYSATLSGGSDKVIYSVMAGYYDQEGQLINTGFQRFNTRSNIKYTHNKITIGANVSLSIEDKQVGSPSMISQAIRYSPIQTTVVPGDTEPVYNTTGAFQTSRGMVAKLINVTDDWRTYRATVNFNLGYDITKDLNISTRFSTGLVAAFEEYFRPFQEIYDTDGELANDIDQSWVKNSATNTTSTTWDVSLNYKKKFGDHSITALGVFSTEKYSSSGFTATEEGVMDNNVESFDSTVVDAAVSSLGSGTNTLVGGLTRILYDWKSRYMVSASIRADASSRFSAANRWGYFPSVSAAWNISDEQFWDRLHKTINTLKLRASHGTTGNQNFSNFSYTNYVSYGYDAAFGQTGSEEVLYGAAQDAFANYDVKWETTIQDNFGVDMAFFNNQLTLTAEYYNTRKKDMLFDVTLPSSSGVYDGTSMTYNVGNMTNQGYELAISYNHSFSKDFSLQMNGTFSTNDNKITYLPTTDTFILTSDSGIDGDQVTALAQGYEAGAFFIFTTDGIVDTQEKLAEYKQIDSSAQMGDLIYNDNDGDGKITSADRVYAGSGLPEYEIGFSTNIRYKQFDFSMQWYSALGHEIMNGAKMVSYSEGRNVGLLSQWSESNPTSSIPSYRGDNDSHANYKGYTDLWLEDGSYLRLKNITLGYSLSKRVLKKLSISKARFYISAQNPITITNYSGYNPEVGGNIKSMGLDKANYPASITYSAGLNFTL